MKKQYFRKLGRDLYRNKMLYLMFLPGFAFIIIFNYIPLYGVTIAFRKYSIFKGIDASPWIGMTVFQKLFNDPSFLNALKNNIIISIEKLIFGFPTPIILSLMINELRYSRSRKLVQTSIILPNFVSWIVISGLLYALFNTTSGAIPGLYKALGSSTVPNVLTTKNTFRIVIIASYLWKSGGYATIIYLAAIAGIDQQMYEAAEIDGAGRMQRMWHITLGSLRSTIVMLLIIRLGEMMYAGFDQIYAIQNYAVISVSEILDTYVYKMGLEGRKFSEATAAGLFQSVVGLVLVLITNAISHRLDADSSLF